MYHFIDYYVLICINSNKKLFIVDISYYKTFLLLLHIPTHQCSNYKNVVTYKFWFFLLLLLNFLAQKKSQSAALKTQFFHLSISFSWGIPQRSSNKSHPFLAVVRI